MFKGFHGWTIKGHESNKKVMDIFRQAMLNELKDRVDISENLIPDWPVYLYSPLSSNKNKLTRVR
jgi:hypothetical protein